MEFSTLQQVIAFIQKSQRILLLTHAHADADGLGAMLSLGKVLAEMGKDITAATNDPLHESLSFLPYINLVQNSVPTGKDFIITLDTSVAKVSKIRYGAEENKVNIIITPKTGMFKKDNVTILEGANQYDLIITFDTGNLEHLGALYEQNTELFFEVPIINVDHHASNTSFGQINLVDVVSSSTTEVVFALLREMEKQQNKKLITEDIATLLLAGIITDTGSFQHANTSPKSMEAAADLIELGARQQEIIKNIYKTKKLSTLKLWGIVLSKVQVDPVHRMVWSTISKEDLLEAGADPEETGTIIDDLLSNAPGAEIIFMIKEQPGYTSVSMRSTTDSADVGRLCAELGGGGHVRAAGTKIKDGRPFEEAVNFLISKVRDYQSKRLNLHPQEPMIVPKVQEPAVIRQPEKPTTQAKPQEPVIQKPKNETVLEFKAPQKPVPKPQPEKPSPKAEPQKPAPKQQPQPPKPVQKPQPPKNQQPPRQQPPKGQNKK